MSINEKPFVYVAFGGTRFTSPRYDLKGGLLVERPKYHDELSEEERSARLVADTADMVSHFATEIFPKLNGFSGWSSVQIIVRD